MCLSAGAFYRIFEICHGVAVGHGRKPELPVGTCRCGRIHARRIVEAQNVLHGYYGNIRTRAEGAQLRRDLHYGQYLEIPKGRRDIFASRERRTRIKTAVALFVVLAVLAVVVFFVWEYMQSNWGSTAR